MTYGLRLPETNFWKLLKAVQAGPNTMGDITQQGLALTSEQNVHKNQPGAIYVEARPMGGGGYMLKATKDGGEDGGPNVQLVYWLPWKNYEATSVKRSKYETGDCNFFMTTALTGCRFTLTPTLVIHVANAAYLGPGSQSQGRSNVEEIKTGPRHAHTRRLSISPPQNVADIQYNQLRTLVFGMKLYDGTWAYKIYHSRPAPGTWEIM